MPAYNYYETIGRIVFWGEDAKVTKLHDDLKEKKVKEIVVYVNKLTNAGCQNFARLFAQNSQVQSCVLRQETYHGLKYAGVGDAMIRAVLASGSLTSLTLDDGIPLETEVLTQCLAPHFSTGLKKIKVVKVKFTDASVPGLYSPDKEFP